MRKRNLLVVLMISFVLAYTFGQKSNTQPSVAPKTNSSTAATTPQTKGNDSSKIILSEWEYLIDSQLDIKDFGNNTKYAKLFELNYILHGEDSSSISALEANYNTLGHFGWELVSTAPLPVFKRLVSEERNKNESKEIAELVKVLVKKTAAMPKPKIKIATDATWPPMEYVDENKKIVGFTIDLVKEVARAGGFEVEIKNVPWDEIFAGLALGNYKAIASSVTITEERKTQMEFSEPYLNVGQVLVVAKATNGITTLADMAGTKVGAWIGTSGEIEISKVPGVVLKTYDEIGLAFEDLTNENIQGLVIDLPIAANFVLQNAYYKDRLMIVGSPFTDEYLGFAFKKDDIKTQKMFNDGLAKVKTSGKLAELEKMWLK